MCPLSLSLDIIILNNTTCQSNNQIWPNTESTIIFHSLFIIIFADSIFVLVGLFALLFFGKNESRPGEDEYVTKNIFPELPIQMFVPASQINDTIA